MNLELSVFQASASFHKTYFHDSVRFFGSASTRTLEDGVELPALAIGKDSSLDFQHARIEHPDRVAFHTLILRPHWFINVDSRRFVFTEVSWDWERRGLEQEIAALAAMKGSPQSGLLARACRDLAENAESNNRYEDASRFRYWAMDLARRAKWENWRFWKTDWLHMLYWIVSGYGERILPAFGWLLGVWFVFALAFLYAGFVNPQTSSEARPAKTLSEPRPGTQPNEAQPSQPPGESAGSLTNTDEIGAPLRFKRSLSYSLAVMSLQKPEPKPLTNTAHALVTLESILGPLQAALLALAIRRKFMR